jgi:hypothetical protein
VSVSARALGKAKILLRDLNTPPKTDLPRTFDQSLADLVAKVKNLRSGGIVGPFRWEQDCDGDWSFGPGILITNYPDGTPGGDAADKANAQRLELLWELENTAIRSERLLKAINHLVDVQEKHRAKIAFLEEQLMVQARERLMQVYRGGVVENGVWTHPLAPCARELAAAAGFDPAQEIYEAEKMLEGIQRAAEQALSATFEHDPDPFPQQDCYWLDADPDESGGSAHNALGNIAEYDICEMHSSLLGPTRFVFNAPTLAPDDDDTEVLHFETYQQAEAAVKERQEKLAEISGGERDE